MPPAFTPLDPVRLTPLADIAPSVRAWAAALRGSGAPLLPDFRPPGLDELSWTPASVLVLLYGPTDSAGLEAMRVVVIRRPNQMPSHAGQYGFPGGKRSPEDHDALETALRETHEEVGIPPARVQVLGQLGPVYTPTRYEISPFVGFAPGDEPLAPCSREVAEVVEIPFDWLADPANKVSEQADLGHFGLGRVALHSFQYGRHLVWGATAQMIHDFFTRVGLHPPVVAEGPATAGSSHLPPSVEQRIVSIPAMDSVTALRSVESALSPLDGFRGIVADIPTRLATVRWQAPLTWGSLAVRLQALGFPPHDVGATGGVSEAGERQDPSSVRAR